MPELNLDAYARILAHFACRRDVPPADILRELGIDAETLRQAEPALREELAAAFTSRKGVAAMKFAETIGSELMQLALLGESALDRSPAVTATELPRESELPSFLHAPQPAAAIPPLPGGSPLAGTADLNVRAIIAAVQRGALPFAQAEASTRTTTAPKPTENKPTTDDSPPRRASTGTVQADYRGVVAAAEQSSLPFTPSEASGAPTPAGTPQRIDFALLPLETYASVSGALARGASRDDALARHGVRPEVFDTLAKAWAERFQREPELFVKFKELARSNAGRREE